MTDIYSVAQYIFLKSNTLIATMQVQRLTFISNLYYFHLYAKPLYPELSYKGKTSPISHELQKLHRNKYLMPDLEIEPNLTETEKQAIDRVLNIWGLQWGEHLAEWCRNRGLTGNGELIDLNECAIL